MINKNMKYGLIAVVCLFGGSLVYSMFDSSPVTAPTAASVNPNLLGPAEAQASQVKAVATAESGEKDKQKVEVTVNIPKEGEDATMSEEVKGKFKTGSMDTAADFSADMIGREVGDKVVGEALLAMRAYDEKYFGPTVKKYVSKFLDRMDNTALVAASAFDTGIKTRTLALGLSDIQFSHDSRLTPEERALLEGWTYESQDHTFLRAAGAAEEEKFAKNETGVKALSQIHISRDPRFAKSEEEQKRIVDWGYDKKDTSFLMASNVNEQKSLDERLKGYVTQGQIRGARIVGPSHNPYWSVPRSGKKHIGE